MISTLLWFFLVTILSVEMVESTLISVCDEKTRYEYDIEECPGGIQIRNLNKWFSKSRDQNCICGEGALVQFDGKEDFNNKLNTIYPIGTPIELASRIFFWQDYSLSSACELLKGNLSSALFINTKKYENPANFPTRAVELNVAKFENNRLPGHFKISMTSGLDSRQKARLSHFLRAIILNTAEPFLVVKDPLTSLYDYTCAYNPQKPEVQLHTYLQTTWGNQDLAHNCEKNVYEPFNRTKYICPTRCENLKKYEAPPTDPTKDQPVLQFRKFMLSMAEISIRMRFAEKFVAFTQQDHPYAAILQYSCRVFYKAFPSVVKWDTLMNAVTLFGVAFEGLVPSIMDELLFNQIKVFLGRCSLQEARRSQENLKILNEVCPSVKGAVELEMNSSIANINLNPKSSDSPASKGGNKITRSSGGGGGGGESQQKMRISFGGAYNIVVELLWKIVQFTHGACMPSADHYPNIHHAFTIAMMEMFSAPAVQLLWYMQEKYDYRQLGKAMVHIFPELPDHVLPLMEILLEKLRFSMHFSILQRPKIEDLDGRDMRCAGLGKVIWGGKACCYQKNEDKKFYFFNKVAFAKL